jgi:hypothetical protein
VSHYATLDYRIAKRFADERVVRKCGSKKRFASRKEVKARIKNTFSDAPLFFYKCHVCHGFHLTRRPMP